MRVYVVIFIQPLKFGDDPEICAAFSTFLDAEQYMNNKTHMETRDGYHHVQEVPLNPDAP